jgi:peptide/nickel transport system permease protein
LRRFLVTAALACLAMFMAWGLTGDPAEVAFDRTLTPPAIDAPLGRDHLGRNLAVRLVHGAYVTLSVTAVVTLFNAVFGTACSGSQPPGARRGCGRWC